MALHQLTPFTLGVPNLAETAAYHREFGLADEGDGWLATRDGGHQLRLVPAATAFVLAPDDLAGLMAGSHSAT